MAKVVISASSLPAGRNMSCQLEYIKRVQNYGADMYHIDVMDGKFVPHKAIDYNYMEQLRENSVLLFDVHLMVLAPKKSLLKKYIKAGAHILTIHYEAYDNKLIIDEMIKYIKDFGCMAGIAFDLDTKTELMEYYLDKIDVITILSVKAGKGGQAFNEEALKKIKDIRAKNKNILIEVDGGINDITGAKCIKAGADILSVGSYIYNNDAYEAIQSLKGKK